VTKATIRMGWTQVGHRGS